MHCISKRVSLASFTGIALGLISSGHTGTIDKTGYVNMLEVWFNGNIAFTLSPAATSCNQQFILNVSSPGTKNLYATLLAAKTKGVQVRIYGSDTCAPAEGGGGSYNQVSYIYLLDS